MNFWKKPEQPQIFLASTGDETVTMLGRYAGQLLKNPAMDAAFKRIEEEIFTAWKTSAPKDQDAREKLYYRMEGIALVRLKLEGMVQNMVFEERKKAKA